MQINVKYGLPRLAGLPPLIFLDTPLDLTLYQS